MGRSSPKNLIFLNGFKQLPYSVTHIVLEVARKHNTYLASRYPIALLHRHSPPPPQLNATTRVVHIEHQDHLIIDLELNGELVVSKLAPIYHLRDKLDLFVCKHSFHINSVWLICKRTATQCNPPVIDYIHIVWKS